MKNIMKQTTFELLKKKYPGNWYNIFAKLIVNDEELSDEMIIHIYKL